MPPTFPLFIGLILYIGILAIAFVVYIPMLFIKTKRLLAKKIFITIAISFPCLIIVGLAITAIFLFPALIFSWLANNNYIPRVPGIILTISGLLIFITSIAVCSLYLWYFISNIIYNRLDKRPISEFLQRDKIYNYLRPYLVKLKAIK